ncbi:MAG: hypothetical protein QME49_01725 [bacterium]|nr:hypothetical protein [bacterium]
MRENRIVVLRLINSRFATSIEKGLLLFKEITERLETEGTILFIDFSNIKATTATFWETIVCLFYDNYGSLFLDDRIKIEYMLEKDMDILRRVTGKAKEYFEDKDAKE